MPNGHKINDLFCFRTLICRKISTKEVLSPARLKTFICDIQSSENLTKSVDELYKLSNYSHGYLCVLKKIHGNTPGKYVINLKINYATKLLQDSSLSIAQLSGLVYYNQCNFVKQFKKESQRTPRKRRSFHRKDLQLSLIGFSFGRLVCGSRDEEINDAATVCLQKSKYLKSILILELGNGCGKKSQSIGFPHENQIRKRPFPAIRRRRSFLSLLE